MAGIDLRSSTSQSGAYAPIDSPALTGSPTINGAPMLLKLGTSVARYVDYQNGNDSNLGSSWDAPLKTFATAFSQLASAANYGDVYAAPGFHDVSATVEHRSGHRVHGFGQGPAAGGGTVVRWTGADDGSPIWRTARDPSGATHYDFAHGILERVRFTSGVAGMSGGGVALDLRNLQNMGMIENVFCGYSATDGTYAMPAGGIHMYEDAGGYTSPGAGTLRKVWCVGGVLPWHLRRGYTTLTLVDCYADARPETTAAFTVDVPLVDNARGGRDMELTMIGCKFETNYATQDGYVFNTDVTATMIGCDARAASPATGKAAFKWNATSLDPNDVPAPSLDLINCGAQNYPTWLDASSGYGLTIVGSSPTSGNVVRRTFLGSAHIQTSDGYPRRAALNSGLTTKYLSGETTDRLHGGGSQSLTLVAATVYATRIFLRKGAYTTATLNCTAVASGSPSGIYVGIYDTSWSLLATSADVTSTFTSTGVKTVPLSYTVPADGYYYMAFMCAAATTPPQVSGGNIGSQLAGAVLPVLNTKHNATVSTLPATLVPTSTYAGFQPHWIRYEGAS